MRVMKTKESKNPAAPESFIPMANPARSIIVLCIRALVIPTVALPRMMLSRLIGVTMISFRKPFSRSQSMSMLVVFEAKSTVIDIIPGVKKLR